MLLVGFKESNYVKGHQTGKTGHREQKGETDSNPSPVDLPLPRFAGLKSEPEMKYAAVPPRAEGQGPRSGAGSWTPDRRRPGDREERKVSPDPPRTGSLLFALFF